MPSDPLRNLVGAKQLKAEPPDRKEFENLVRSGRSRLADACRPDNSWESRFDLAYNAAHALSLAALRRVGYRSENRYLVFQCLPHTLGLKATDWRVLALAHERRNAAEYGGEYDADERLLAEVIRVTKAVLAKVEQAGPPQ
jgi:hypothetical protein